MTARKPFQPGEVVEKLGDRWRRFERMTVERVCGGYVLARFQRDGLLVVWPLTDVRRVPGSEPGVTREE